MLKGYIQQLLLLYEQVTGENTITLRFFIPTHVQWTLVPHLLQQCESHGEILVEVMPYTYKHSKSTS